jgi:chorismate dehydratase
MNIILPTLPEADYFETVLQTQHEVHRLPLWDTFQALSSAQTDVALVPLLDVLKDHDHFDILPHIALCLEETPFAKLAIQGDLLALKRIGFPAVAKQEVLIMRTILREHYDLHPKFTPINPEMKAVEGLLFLQEANVSADWVMDIGQEWYEYANYPLPYAVFVCRKDHFTKEAAQQFILPLQSQARFAEWNEDRAYAHFSPFLNDAAFAGMDVFAEQMFFDGALDEIPEFPFLNLEDEKETAFQGEEGDEGEE